ncbi:hypothetical protein L1887_57122 [Cichorium endivia]|nr:hypothetical protein L1887_57122 [Cichorium endivia]
MHLPQLLVLHRAERAILLERMGQSEQSVRCSVKCSAKRSAKWDGSQAGELHIAVLDRNKRHSPLALRRLLLSPPHPPGSLSTAQHTAQQHATRLLETPTPPLLRLGYRRHAVHRTRGASPPATGLHLVTGAAPRHKPRALPSLHDLRDIMESRPLAASCTSTSFTRRHSPLLLVAHLLSNVRPAHP